MLILYQSLVYSALLLQVCPLASAAIVKPHIDSGTAWSRTAEAPGPDFRNACCAAPEQGPTEQVSSCTLQCRTESRKVHEDASSNTASSLVTMLSKIFLQINAVIHAKRDQGSDQRVEGKDRPTAVEPVGDAAPVTMSTATVRTSSSLVVTTRTSSLDDKSKFKVGISSSTAESTSPGFDRRPESQPTVTRAAVVAFITTSADVSSTQINPVPMFAPAPPHAKTSIFDDNPPSWTRGPGNWPDSPNAGRPTPSAVQVTTVTSTPMLVATAPSSPGQPEAAPALRGPEEPPSFVAPDAKPNTSIQRLPDLVPAAPTTVLAGSQVATLATGAIFIGTQIIPVGSSVVMGSGTSTTLVALITNVAGQTELMVGSSTTTLLPSPVQTPEVSTFAGHTVAAKSSKIVIGDQTLTPGQTVTVGTGASRTVVGVMTNGEGKTELIVGGSTIVLPTIAPAITTAGLTIQQGPHSAAVVNGHFVDLGSALVLGSGSFTTKVYVATDSKGETMLMEASTTIILSATDALAGYIAAGLSASSTSVVSGKAQSTTAPAATLPSSGIAVRHEGMLGGALIGGVGALLCVFA